MTAAARRLWRMSLRLTAAILITLALAVGLFRLALPLVPNYHAQIERWAGQALDVRVALGAVDARWPLLGWPQLTFEDAALWAPEGDALLLTAERGRVAINLFDLFARREVRPGPVLLHGVVIDVDHDDDAGWRVLGRPISPGRAASSARPAGAQALPRGTLELHDATVIVQDDRLPADVPPLQITGVSLRYERRGQSLAVEGSLRPTGPSSLVEVSIRGQQARGRDADTRWQLFVDGRGIDLGAVARAARLEPAGFEASGDVRLWAASSGGRIEQALIACDLDDVVVAVAGGASATYDVLRGRVDFAASEGGWSVAGRDLQLERGGHRWPAGDLDVSFRDGGLHTLRADYLRLDDLMPFVPLVAPLAPPATAPTLQRLSALAPRGELSALDLARRNGRLTLDASFSAFGVAPAAGRPGVEGLTGRVEMEGDDGELALDSESMVLRLPDLYAEGVPPLAVDGTLNWSGDGEQLTVVSRALAVRTPAFAARGALEVRLPTGAGQPSPWLDLQISMEDVMPAALGSFVPTAGLHPKVAAWLRRAFHGGSVPAASISFTGPVREFPFDGGGGRFEARAQFEDLEFQYALGWPRAERLSGVVGFTNARMEGEAFSGEVLGNELRSLDVVIEDLRKGVIDYRSRTWGEVPAVMAYLRNSPLAEYVRPVEDSSGRSEVSLSLRLPLLALEQSTMSAAMKVMDGAVTLDGMLPLTEVAGTLGYDTGNGLTGEDIEARVLDRPVRLSVVPERDAEGRLAASRLELDGRFRTDRLLARIDPRLADFVDGTSDVHATARLAPGAPGPAQISIASDLVGTALHLPPPLDKPASLPLATRLRLAPDRGGETVVGVAFGERFSADVALAGEGAAMRPSRIAVTFGGTRPALPETSGIVVEGRTARMDLSGWLGLLTSLGQPQEAGAEAASATDGGDGDGGRLAARGTDTAPSPARGGSTPERLAPPLREMTLVIDEALVAGQRLAGLAITRADEEARLPEAWDLELRGQGVAGTLSIPRAAGGAPITARFRRLELPGTEVRAGDGAAGVVASSPAAPVPAAAAEAPDPRALPSLSVLVDAFAWGRLQLGRVELSLDAIEGGVRLTRLTAEGEDFTARGAGEWTVGPLGELSHLDVTLRSTDLLDTLETLGFAGSLSADQASLEALLNWQGPPRWVVDERLSGEVSVAIGPGQLLNVRPGAGKIFGLMSVAALPRRLELDFRDIFDRGLGFDAITGSFTIEGGQAYTEDLSLVGQTADVTIFGRTGLTTRDYDQTAVVAANVGTSLPVAGALAGGPIVGAALLIFSEVMKEPLKDLSRTQYRITGPWTNPSVQRVALPNPQDGATEEDEQARRAPSRQPSG
jgi:uncharacterized protein (TIGR02099 family)